MRGQCFRMQFRVDDGYRRFFRELFGSCRVLSTAATAELARRQAQSRDAARPPPAAQPAAAEPEQLWAVGIDYEEASDGFAGGTAGEGHEEGSDVEEEGGDAGEAAAQAEAASSSSDGLGGTSNGTRTGTAEHSSGSAEGGAASAAAGTLDTGAAAPCSASMPLTLSSG